MALFITALVLVALAELADKSQLLALGLATKYRPATVLVGVFVAGLALNVIAALAGSTFGELVPAGVLAWLVGVLFIGFGVWTLRSAGGADDDESHSTARRVRGPFATVVASFFLAEMGDKTQLLVATLSADPQSISSGGAVGSLFGSSESNLLGLSQFEGAALVVLGATVGMVLADGLAIAVGVALGKRLPQETLARVSGTIFIIFGVITIAARVLGG